MAKTIFELLNNINYSKDSWEILTNDDRTQYSKYMINRFLSMDFDLIEIVNDIQFYDSVLSNEQSYRLYCDILPKRKFFKKYISSKNKLNANTNLINFFIEAYQISETDAENVIEHLTLDDIKNELIKYGFDKKILKQKFDI